MVEEFKIINSQREYVLLFFSLLFFIDMRALSMDSYKNCCTIGKLVFFTTT